jgi:hypothetical protein
MEVGQEEERVPVARGVVTAADVHTLNEGKERVQLDAAQEDDTASPVVLHGPKLWLLLAGIYLGIYLVALELTILSTLSPTLTNEFGAVADISWYESAYVLALSVFSPMRKKRAYSNASCGKMCLYSRCQQIVRTDNTKGCLSGLSGSI